MKKIIIGFSILFGLVAFLPHQKATKITRNSSLYEVQNLMGMSMDSKLPNKSIKGVNQLIGEDIVKKGFSRRSGIKKSRRQSKHFVCTSCHNIVKEDPDLSVASPEARLSYVSEKGIPFLQATTLYGAVNRESYYNGDYDKKYGELVAPARNNIREAIQLCAVECAQGRKLKEWELESILAYLWTIDLKLKDLKLSDEELSSIVDAVENPLLHEEGLKVLSSKYLKKSEATFIPPPKDRKIGVGLAGDPQNGKLIYQQSCLHCHYQKRYSFLHLDSRKMSFTHLNNKADTYNRHSLYQVARYGTFSKYGKGSYMPGFMAERLSEQQLADLRSYIAQQADEL